MVYVYTVGMYIQSSRFYGVPDKLDYSALIADLFAPLIRRHQGNLLSITNYVQRTFNTQSILVERYHAWAQYRHLPYRHVLTTSDVLNLCHLSFLKQIQHPNLIQYCQNIQQYEDQLPMMDSKYHLDVYFLHQFHQLLKGKSTSKPSVSTLEKIQKDIQNYQLTIGVIEKLPHSEWARLSDFEKQQIVELYQDYSTCYFDEYDYSMHQISFHKAFAFDWPLYWSGWCHNNYRGVNKLGSETYHYAMTAGVGALWDAYAIANPERMLIFQELYIDQLIRPSDMLHFLKTGMFHTMISHEESLLF